MLKRIGKCKKIIFALTVLTMFMSSIGLYANVPKYSEKQVNGWPARFYDGMAPKEFAETFKRVEDEEGLLAFKTDLVIEIVIGKDGKVDKQEIYNTSAWAAYAFDLVVQKELAKMNKWPDFLSSGGIRMDYNNPQEGYNELVLVAQENESPFTPYAITHIKVSINKEGDNTIKQPEKVDFTKVDKKTFEFKDLPRIIAKDNLALGITQGKINKVYDLYEKSIVGGNEYGELKYYSFITRAEFAKLLVTSLNLKSTGKTEGFSDTKGHWAEETINIAVDNGLLSGVAKDKFAPNAKITLEQISAIVVRVLENNGKSSCVTDEDIKMYYKNSYGLTWGKESYVMCMKLGLYDDIFYEIPKDTSRKLDVLAIIYNLMNYLK